MKPIRLQVRMPTIGMFSIKGRSAVGDVEQLTETMVIALRRTEHKGVISEDIVRALAFVPEQFRAHLRQSGRLVDGEYVWCFAAEADNKKSLALFMASGDREWNPEGKSVSEIKVNVSKSNITKHRAVLDEKTIQRVLSEAVASASGIVLGARGVSVHVYVTTRDSSAGHRAEGVVEITVDHDLAPTAADSE